MVLALGLAALPAPAAALSCGGKPVGEGDTAAEARCGPPADRVAWRVDVLGGGRPGPGGAAPLLVRTDAEWVFNSGPTRALGIVDLRDGLVVRAGSGAFGYRESDRPGDIRPDPRCRLGTFSSGEVRARVRGLCGEPARVDGWTERRPQAGLRGLPERVHVRVEEWTYNFGRFHLTYTYAFENGRLVRVRSGDFGW